MYSPRTRTLRKRQWILLVGLGSLVTQSLYAQPTGNERVDAALLEPSISFDYESYANHPDVRDFLLNSILDFNPNSFAPDEHPKARAKLLTAAAFRADVFLNSALQVSTVESLRFVVIQRGGH